jgi:hypothetical protein
VCIEAKSSVSNLGISPSSSEQLFSIVKDQGFEECYESSFMKLNRSDYYAWENPGKLELVQVDNDNKNEYVIVHNNAFRNAANGCDT